MAALHTDRHQLAGTPIGRLFDMGLSDTQIGDITQTSSSGVNKWRNGLYPSGPRQERAKVYLDGLSVPHDAPSVTPPQGSITCMMEVPTSKMKKVTAILSMVGISIVPLDD